MQTIEEYLLKFTVLDKSNDMDGLWVPLHIAELAIQQALAGKLSFYKQRIPRINKTHPLLWGDGWYAVIDPDYDPDDPDTLCWCVAPKKFFDEKGHCPDGWEWEIPEGMTSEQLDEFIEKHGYEPDIPDEFSYIMESGISTDNDKYSLEEQKKMLRDFGFIVDNVPEWGFNRKRIM